MVELTKGIMGTREYILTYVEFTFFHPSFTPTIFPLFHAENITSDQDNELKLQNAGV